VASRASPAPRLPRRPGQRRDRRRHRPNHLPGHHAPPRHRRM